MNSLFNRYVVLGLAWVFIMVNGEALQAAQWDAQPGSIWQDGGNEIIVAKSWVSKAAKKVGNVAKKALTSKPKVILKNRTVASQLHQQKEKIREKKKF